MADRKVKNTSQKTPIWFILISGCLITLYFNPSLQDPFNSPKFWILSLAGSWLIGYLITNSAKKKINLEFQFLPLILSLFMVSMIISLMFTDSKFSAFFGDSGRRIGFLTYLFFAVFMYASYKYFTINELNKFYKSTFVLSLITLVYATMQATGNDFATWANPYNSIIGSFGNPNFASAGMAIFAIICYSSLFNSALSKLIRAFNISMVLGLMLLIIRSDSRQGLIVFAIGFGFFTSVYVFSKRRKIGMLFFILTIMSTVFSVLGMLQIGPLQQYLYKASVSVRGYYWQAAFEMFKSNPLVGVGIDQYGLFFKKYRDLQYPLNYGFEITSSNAHSIPLQLLATGGLFVGFLYVILMGYIFIQGIKAIFTLESNERYLLTGVFSAWLGFQAQSLISIENIGLGIWNWIFGGIIIGIAKSSRSITEIKVNEKIRTQRQVNNLRLMQPVFSGVFAFASLLFIAPLYTGEMDTMKARSFYDPARQTQSKEFNLYSEKAVTAKFNDPYYKLIVLEMMLQSESKDKALIYLQNLHLADPKNLDFLRPLAIVYEQKGELNEAIKYRKLIESEDPWNLDNFLRQGYLYKNLGDSSNVSKMLEKITSIAPNHIIASTAKQQLSM